MIQFQYSFQFDFCPVTRGFKKQVAALDIKLYPKVKIERNLAFERHLLANPKGLQNDFRRNLSRRTLPPEQTSIPIGARGRKRNTITLLSVVCVPNPDGRRQYAMPPNHQTASGLSHHQPTNLDNPQVNNEATLPSHQPAKRTYARASSTPNASSTLRHRPRVLSFPAPDELSVTDLSLNESSVDVDFVEFGRLHYDTSETE